MGLEDPELEEDDEALAIPGGRVFEVALKNGQVDMVRTRRVVGEHEVERMRIRSLWGGRRCHRMEDRAALPASVRDKSSGT